MSPPNTSSGQPRDFSGRVVLITGAGSGVGLECARVFATQGAKLLLVGRSADKLEAAVATLADETKAQAAICAGDVTDSAFATAAMEAAQEAFAAPVEVLVNNAAVVENIPFAEQSLERLDAIVDSNLKGTMYCTHSVLQHMIPRKAGRIVNISSVAGVRGISGQASYCASKHGMVGFADALTQELVPHNIQVATICPGAIDTPLWDPEQNPYPGEVDISKTIQPGEIVDLVCYLLSQPEHSIFKRIVLFPRNEWH